MTGRTSSIAFIAVALASATALLSEGCRAVDGKTSDRPPSAAAISAAPASVVEQPVARFVQATGSLIADQRAEVAAETRGRVVRAPIERGTPVAEGDELVRLSSTETEAQAREAEANASQIEARLGLASDSTFDAAKYRRCKRPRLATSWPRAISTASSRCSRSASCRRPSSISDGRRWRRPASSTRARETRRRSSIRRFRRRAPGSPRTQGPGRHGGARAILGPCR